MGLIEEKLVTLGIELEEVPKPVAEYVPSMRTGDLVYTSGCDCRKNGVLLLKGKLGKELTVEDGQAAARQVMINILSVLSKELGTLDRVKKVIKMLAFVNSTDEFNEQPYVINGASQLLVEVFGEKGRHARSAIGTNTLPFDTPVEIELIVQVEE
ncbi:RidA family protein [Enterococcus hulanensis]|uniref:RidA family protein n=1 Tax=Enterococcus hulanensis TaxID=2559929 RepID=UPI001A8FAEE7|nr:RidA family protein [Enterococcus hulanensis]MBO0455356.1 RidA family protein [Enterococcus hulanensis]